ncbi:52 kDa repressor of the inhibitor of the protein kinase-like [Antedon mediterranea]|uniref:52 kDa repressor of the inhibitor of the protein kinase-like n=1 Tax=Antedon mediterranea TaxID=105859 RepID=UPI003AF75FFA
MHVERYAEYTRPWSSESRNRAGALLRGMTDFNFIVSFKLAYHGLAHLHGITIKLQKRSLDILEAHEMVTDIKNLYKQIRDDCDFMFKECYESACRMARSVNIEPSLPRCVARQTHRSNAPASSPEEYYRQLEINSSKLLGLIPSVIIEKQVDISATVALYEDDLPSPELVSAEMVRWKAKFKNMEKAALPSSGATAIKHCDSEMFPNIFVLLKLACTFPVTSCECERSASVLRRLNTYTRCTMNEDRLSALALMHIHYDIDIDVSETVNIFSQLNPRRMQLKNIIHEYKQGPYMLWKMI